MLYIHISILASISRPKRPLYGLTKVKEQEQEISVLKHLGIYKHRGINKYFNFGLHFEAKEAIKRPHGGQGAILRSFLRSMTQVT